MILFLFACVGNPELTPSEQGCTNVDFTEDQPSTLESSVSGSVADVWRTYVQRPNMGDRFAPDILPDGDVVEVHEAWEAADDATETCLEPHVEIRDFGAPIEVRWFTDDGTVPFDSITVTPE